MYDHVPIVAAGLPWLGLASFVLFWAAVFAGIVLLVRYLTRPGRPPFASWPPGPPPGMPPYPPPGRLTPEQILAERFARGEIDEPEFRQRLAALRGEAPGPGAPPPAP